MKIHTLEIENFKAIKHIKLSALNNTVLIAGPNGCGKSCIFHAIRLLKSVVGGYQANEWHLWLNEFQINPNNIHQEIIKLFQTEDRDLKISIKFELTNSEREFLKQEGRYMLESIQWRRVSGFENSHYRFRPLGPQYTQLATEISQKCDPEFNELQKELSSLPFFSAILVAQKHQGLQLSSSKVLNLAFSFFDENLGIIDYHGPNRAYYREQLNQINLNVQTDQQNKKQNFLYNQAQKYTNVKQEIAGDYIRQLLIKETGGLSGSSEDSDLIETLQKLFEDFFPGKKFLGPKPNKNGGIDFPVELKNKKKHDINDLSSGEHEVLYGYLRLRNSAPKNSIILLDEPELHLNPRLIASLPKFYKKHIGENLGNQIFLITHSDTFLREAVKEKGYQIYHIKPPSDTSSYEENQIKKIDDLKNTDLQEAILDLVGDLATYSPDKKIVLLEGENSEFDLRMITKLFPDFSERVNLLSVGSKNKVSKLHFLLEEAHKKGALQQQFFSIVDKDLGAENVKRSNRAFEWNVYHIESYLLNEYYLAKSIKGLVLEEKYTEEEILTLLIKCAKKTINNLIKDILINKAHKETFGTFGLGCDPKEDNISRAIYESLRRNIDKVSKIPTKEYLNTLKDIEKEKRKEIEEAFKNDCWKKIIKGRDVLKNLVSEINNKNSSDKFSYKTLRNNIIHTMSTYNHMPEGMKEIIQEIEKA